MAIFGPNRWVKPFGKISIFRLFKLFVFMAQKGVFFPFQNIVEYIFLVYIASKKKLEKWPFLDQDHGLTLLEKCQFFDFFNFLFLQPRKVFFRFRILQNTFSQSILRKKKKLGKMVILDQNHGLTHLKKSQFYDFLNFLFLQPRNALFRFRIS